MKKEIEEKIDTEINKTIESISEYKKLTKPISPENSIGRVSRMDAINNKSVMEAALRNMEEKLLKLKFVKSKIDNDDFGICTSCKNEIPLGRILIVPESRFCVKCARYEKIYNYIIFNKFFNYEISRKRKIPLFRRRVLLVY